jgi:hypothetical protein
MALRFYENDDSIVFEQKESLINITIEECYEKTEFNLNRDDIVILIRHLNAYLETGNLMNVKGGA